MIDHLFSFLIANAEGICEVDGEWVAIGVYCLGEAARVHVEEARRVAHPLLRLGLARWPDPPSDAPVSPELWAGVLRALSELVEPEGSLAYLIVESAERADIGVTRVGGRPIGVDELRWPCSPQTLHNDDRMIHLLTLDLEAAPALRAWHPWFSQAAALAIFIADDEPTALPEPRGADVVPLDAAMLAMGDYEGRLPGERCFGHTVRGRYIARTVAVDTKAAHIVELRASPSVDSFRSRSSTDTMDPQDEEVLITDIASAQRLYFEQLLLSHRSELTLALVDADASLEAGVPRLLFTDPATQRPGTLVFRGGRFYVDIAEECS
jgi:hypothetical protein